MKQHLLVLCLAIPIFLQAQKSQIDLPPFSFAQDEKINQAINDSKRAKALQETTLQQILQNIEKGDTKEQVRAIKILAYFNEVESQESLEKLLLTGNSDEVRIEAAKSLGVARSINSKYALIAGLQDENAKVRTVSASSLAKIGEKTESLKYFTKLTLSEKNIPYYTCHRAFLHIATNEVKPLLVKDLANPDPYVSINAAIVLAQLGYKDAAFITLNDALKNNDKYIRMAGLRGLAYIGDSESLHLVDEMLDDKEKLVRERAYAIVSKF